MRAISHREMRNNSAEVLRRVEAGETLTVTNNGKAVAVLRPATKTVLEDLEERGQVRAPLRSRAAWRDLPPAIPTAATGEEILEDLRKPW